MKADDDRLEEIRARWATVALLVLCLLVAAYALVVQAPLAAVAFGTVAVFLALALFLLPARWNRFMIDVLANFGW